MTNLPTVLRRGLDPNFKTARQILGSLPEGQRSGLPVSLWPPHEIARAAKVPEHQRRREALIDAAAQLGRLD